MYTVVMIIVGLAALPIALYTVLFLLWVVAMIFLAITYIATEMGKGVSDFFK